MVNLPVRRDGEKGEQLLQEKDKASLPLVKWPLCMGDANHIRNSNPQHFFFLYVSLYHFLEYALWPRAPQYKQAALAVSRHSGVTRIRLASKNLVHKLFLSFAKEGHDNWTWECFRLSK
jgi:hypothetical protein